MCDELGYIRIGFITILATLTVIWRIKLECECLPLVLINNQISGPTGWVTLGKTYDRVGNNRPSVPEGTKDRILKRQFSTSVGCWAGENCGAEKLLTPCF